VEDFKRQTITHPELWPHFLDKIEEFPKEKNKKYLQTMHVQASQIIGANKPQIIDRKLGIKNKFHKTLEKSDVFKHENQKTPETVKLTDLMNKKKDLKKTENFSPLINDHKKSLKHAIFVLDSKDKTNLTLEERKKLILSATSRDKSVRKLKTKLRTNANIEEDSLDQAIQSVDAKIMKSTDIFNFKIKGKKKKNKEKVHLLYDICFSTPLLPEK